ncbi:MAG: hypothetical protein DRI94_01735, partial [Bacteroidetes bacterium]
MKPVQKISLKEYNTFNIDVNALYSFFCKSEKDLFEILKSDFVREKKIIILGGGSNLLFTGDVEDVLILMRNKGIEIVEKDKETVFVKASAGEIWDEFVDWCVNNSYGGIENLSLIPGTVGASPVQNIGAYGVEVKDVIEELEAVNIKTGEKKVFKNIECNFAYRNSIFKNELKGKVIITHVWFELLRKPKFVLDYGNLANEVEKYGEVNLSNIRKAIIDIRSSKLPDPNEMGNAGSFFKNPVINKDKYERLAKEYSDIKGFKLTDDEYKVPAGWLIEKAGWKGART